MGPAILHITEPGNVGPMLRQYLLAILIPLHLPRAFHPRPFEAQVKPAYASEQGAESQSSYLLMSLSHVRTAMKHGRNAAMQ